MNIHKAFNKILPLVSWIKFSSINFKVSFSSISYQEIIWPNPCETVRYCMQLRSSFNSLTLCLQVPSADNLCKQCIPEFFFEKLIFKRISRWQKSMQTYPGCKELSADFLKWNTPVSDLDWSILVHQKKQKQSLIRLHAVCLIWDHLICAWLSSLWVGLWSVKWFSSIILVFAGLIIYDNWLQNEISLLSLDRIKKILSAVNIYKDKV